MTAIPIKKSAAAGIHPTIGININPQAAANVANINAAINIITNTTNFKHADKNPFIENIPAIATYIEVVTTASTLDIESNDFIIIICISFTIFNNFLLISEKVSPIVLANFTKNFLAAFALTPTALIAENNNCIGAVYTSICVDIIFFRIESTQYLKLFRVFSIDETPYSGFIIPANGITVKSHLFSSQLSLIYILLVSIYTYPTTKM